MDWTTDWKFCLKAEVEIEQHASKVLVWYSTYYCKILPTIVRFYLLLQILLIFTLKSSRRSPLKLSSICSQWLKSIQKREIIMSVIHSRSWRFGQVEVIKPPHLFEVKKNTNTEEVVTNTNYWVKWGMTIQAFALTTSCHSNQQ